MATWITAVVLPSSGTTLRVASDSSAWMGDTRTGEIALYRAFTGPKVEASWLPDEVTARGWPAALRGTKPGPK